MPGRCSELEPSRDVRGIVDTSRCFPRGGRFVGNDRVDAEEAASVLLSQDLPVEVVLDGVGVARDCWESHFARAVESTGQLSSGFAGVGVAGVLLLPPKLRREVHLLRAVGSTGHEGGEEEGSVLEGSVIVVVLLRLRGGVGCEKVGC